MENCWRILESFRYCRNLLENRRIISLVLIIIGKLYNHVFIEENWYYIYEFNIFYIVAIWCIPNVFLMYSCYKFLLYWWKFHIICCIHIITTCNSIRISEVLSDVFILSQHVIPYKNSASYIISRITRNSVYYYMFA